ncbi:MAG: holo-[acyl-carrier-protein] synthase [candidate division Zixibacteria bacterium]|nr:holo-[acyl-carrier-protein] synthase [candidate division Zixibacteria bacterium]
MVKAVGIDIIEISRIRQAIERWGDRFLHRVFTPWEISYCSEKVFPEYSFAARFAAKEAVFKTLGSSARSGIKWTSIEIFNDRNGQPSVRLGGKAKEKLDGGAVLISMSHSHTYAVAQAVLLETSN